MALSPSLRIAVVGVGGIGSTFALHLARDGGHEVTAVARPGSPRLQQLRRDRGIVPIRGEGAAVQVAEALDPAVPYDLVIVTLLAHQVDVVLPTLTRSAAGCILFMFNTFAPERLSVALGGARCAFGMPFVQAHLDPEGRLHAVVGAAGQRSRLSAQRWVALFEAAGLPAVLDPNMPLWLRCHAPLCVALESVSAAAMRRGAGAGWGEAMRLARGVHAGLALLRQQGHRPYPAGKAWIGRSPAWLVAGMLWALSRVRSFRELLATGVGECRALADVMVAAAEREGLPAAAAAIAAMRPPP